ncbi:MAG TPA: hypothetical protein VN327_00730 [Pseudonocardiaceae bacterium]|nr:hypothetical protein [Pseudonocardiaceae bacterium]
MSGGRHGHIGRHDVGAAARAAVTMLCPGFRAREELRSTETSMLWGGFLDGRAVIVKYPLDRCPFWLARARHEIAVYRALPNLAPLPVTGSAWRSSTGTRTWAT